MQTRTSMESTDSMDLEDQPSSRGRNSNASKLKVLVRSHAMREETSPPRDPQSPTTPITATTAQHHFSPCIKLTPSADSHPSSPTLLSPSSASPTSTLVPSPTPTLDFALEARDAAGNKHVSKMNKQNARKKNHHHHQQQQPQHYEEERIPIAGNCECLNNNNNNNTLTVSARCTTRGKLRQQSSSFGSYDGSSPSLSRDNSSEQYTDLRGIDLEQFIPETLNRNQKDRSLMLRIEEELVQFARDKTKIHYKFPPMTSYHRMLVHRCAAYFGMDHNLELGGKSVIVSRTKSTRIPDVEFKAHIKDEFTEEPRRSILKRDSNSIEDYGFKSPDRQFSLESRRSKSFEEREEEYEKARRRIFNKGGNHNCSSEDMAWAEDISWSNNDSDARYRIHHPHRNSRLLKVQSEDPGEETMRPHVAKSYSFGGYGGGGGGLSRGDSIISTHSAGARLFTKQDSAASSVSWRLSPSSSGYKTQSQRSESITPSPTSTPFYSSNESHRQDSTATNASDLPVHDDNQVVWAVTNIQNVPKGSVLINPQTGQPVKNQDGSLYHHDPDNPLPELSPNARSSPLHEEEPLGSPVEQGQSQVISKPPLSPVKQKHKDSPKKRNSPIKKTNSATSPSLPFTPPPLPALPLPAPQSLTSMPSLPSLNNSAPPMSMVQSKSYPSFNEPTAMNQYFGTGYDYGQPCIFYAPYGQMPVGYDTRIEQEVPTTFYMESNQQLGYQPQVFPPQTQFVRYALPVQQQGTTFITTPYAQGPPTQPAPQGADIIPVYPQQPLIYPAQTSALYPQQNVIYAPPPSVYPPQYPVRTPTPNGVYPVDQVVQGVAQMHLAGNTTKNRGGGGGGAAAGGRPSSTDTQSSSVVVFHRQNSETPPSLPPTPGFGGSFPPIFIRQMSNVRSSPPVQTRTSRSPTPGGGGTPTTMIVPDGLLGDPAQVRQRYPMPPFIYQSMPYQIQSENRMGTGRSYRQQSPRPQQQNHYHNHHYNHHHHQQQQQHHQPQQHQQEGINSCSASFASMPPPAPSQGFQGMVDGKYKGRKYR